MALWSGRAVAWPPTICHPNTKILDPAILFYLWPYPTISPDGQWVAYISKGYVCVCNLADPSPRRLAKVPNTWTDLYSQPEFGEDYEAVERAMSREERQQYEARVTDTVYGLQWTRESDGVIFGVQSNNPSRPQERIQSFATPRFSAKLQTWDIPRRLSPDFRLVPRSQILGHPRPRQTLNLGPHYRQTPGDSISKPDPIVH